MRRAGKKIVIIGGGVAGAAVADRLSRSGLEAHLVEKRRDIGGHAAEMGCKATDVCMRCNVCVADEIFRRVRESAATRNRNRHGAAPVLIHASSELLELRTGRNGARFSAVLLRNGGRKRTVEADAVVIAIGYEPFNPAENSSFNYGRLANVITGVEAERQLAEKHRIFRPSDQAAPKRIAFIQCVGSRTEERHRRPEDTDYCSTVCCSYALRMARLIKHQSGESEITVFYMDIQKFGKDFQKFYGNCRDKMRFIRSRPYELLTGPGGTVRVKYAPESSLPKKTPTPEAAPAPEQPTAVCEEEFDLVVLSVGIRPPLDGLSLAEKLGVATDDHGFFGLKGAAGLPDLQRDGIFVAGAAESPKDIAGCIAQADAVSAAILEDLKPAVSRPAKRGVNRGVAVIGGGIAGMRTALSLARLGHNTTLIHEDGAPCGAAAAAPELLGHLAGNLAESAEGARAFVEALVQDVNSEDRITVRNQTSVSGVSGEQGNFSLTLSRGGKEENIRSGAIVIATGADRETAAPAKAGPITNVFGLIARLRAGDCSGKAAIIMDTLGECGRAEWICALTACETLSRRFGTEAKIFCGNVRTAATGLEALYRRAREAGAMVVKYSKKPAVSERNGRALVKCFDPVAGAEIAEEFDFAVAARGSEWAQSAELFRRIAGLRPGPEGEAQPNNIWFLPDLTNRPGVFAVGAARGDSEYRAALTDGLAAAQAIHALLIGDEIRPRKDVASVDADKCVLCLTCLRVCPHGAITIDREKSAAYPSPISCKRCGACVTECPARAISLPGFTDEEMAAAIGSKPKLTVFACENSAIPAIEDAGRKIGKSVNIIKVPCAGDVHPRMVLSALESGAHRVMIIGCHPESCRYLSGSSRAERRMKRLGEMLTKAGFDGSRVSFRGISSVEPGKLVGYVE